MPTTNAYIDRVDILSLEEKLGVIRSLTRKVRVIVDPDDNPNDFTVLEIALDFLENPTDGSEPITPFSSLPDDKFKSLVLVRRGARLAENDPLTVDVELGYEHILDGPNQPLFDGNDQTYTNDGLIFGKGRCSITQKRTNFYIPFGGGKVDRSGNPVPMGANTKDRIQILVAHTFPIDDSGAVAQFNNSTFQNVILPRTGIQSGEIEIPFPQANFQLNGVLTCTDPWSIAWNFVACLNSKTWCDQPPYTWICSEVQWECLNTENSLYRFGFEFQYNSDTWDNTVVYFDQRTGRPPASVEAATVTDTNGVLDLAVNSSLGGGPFPQPAGFWKVPALKGVDFAAQFAATFEGNQPPIVQ